MIPSVCSFIIRPSSWAYSHIDDFIQPTSTRRVLQHVSIVKSFLRGYVVQKVSFTSAAHGKTPLRSSWLDSASNATREMGAQSRHVRSSRSF